MTLKRSIQNYICMLPRPRAAVNNQPPVALSAQMFYNASAPFGDIIEREVICMNVGRFIEAVGASVVGYYFCKALDYVVTLLIG